MKSTKLLAIVAFACAAAGCAASDPFADYPANVDLQREVSKIIVRVKVETGAQLYDDLKRLVAFDVFAIKQVSELADNPNARVRSNALWVLAQIKDPERQALMDQVDRVLRDALDDPEPTVRFEAASGLASRSKWDVLPMLIDGLENADSGVRFRCNEQLMSATSRDFGFSVDGPIEQRTASIERWRTWYSDWRKTEG